MPDVLIVGGGVIGCATAYFLAREGASVTLIERGELGSESSGAAAGLLAALSDEGGDRGLAFQQLCLDSFSLYQTLLPDLDATGVDIRYNRAGILHLVLNEHEVAGLRRRFKSQQKLTPENRWLEGDDLRREEPGANPRAVAGLLSPNEHYLDPRRLVLAFAALARAAGANLQLHTPMTGIDVDQGRVTGVSSGEEHFGANVVLLAGGAWTAGLAAQLGANIPVRPVRGQMLSLRGPAAPLRHVIWGEGAYLVPREEGQTFVGATVEEVGFRKGNTLKGLQRLRQRATELMPELARAEVVSTWSGLRPGSPDGLPILGRLPGHDNVWVATGHFRNGILLAPITGQLIAEGILRGDEPASLLPFSPLRFFS